MKPPAGKRPRVWFVDVVRLLASFQMVNGHTLDAFLVEEVRHGQAFDRYTFVRGLTSVTFLTVAGIAFHLATLARFDQHRSSKVEVQKRFRRAGLLILIGYLLRFPADAFFGDATEAAAAWDLFFSCGVLQCIGVTLFVLELATVAAKKPYVVVGVSAACALLLLGGAPFVHHLPVDGAWRPFTSYLTNAGGALFPLFPWAGFVFLGVVIGWVTLPHGGATKSRVAIPRLALVGLAIVGAHYALEGLGPIGPADVPLSTTPVFSLLKLSFVLAVVFGLAIVCLPVRRLPKLLRILSAQTLFVYAFHLWLIYGGGLASRFGRTLTLPQGLLASATMVVLTTATTVLWHYRKDVLATVKLSAQRLLSDPTRDMNRESHSSPRAASTLARTRKAPSASSR